MKNEKMKSEKEIIAHAEADKPLIVKVQCLDIDGRVAASEERGLLSG
jgi:hypothetical protein